MVSIRHLLPSVLVLVLGLILAFPAASQSQNKVPDFVAADPQEVQAALQRGLKEGAVIRLKPGRYDQITIRGSRGGLVRLVPFDQAQPPEIHRLVIRDSRDIQIEGMDFRPNGGEAQSSYLVNVDGVEGIVFEKNRFVALPDQGERRVRAVRIEHSSQARVRDNVVTDLERGFVFSRMKDIQVEHNSFTGLTTDGLNFVEVEGVLVRQNFFTNFRTDPGQHADYIQFWTRGAKQPSTGIEIAHNVMLQGAGTSVQGVFMDNDHSIPYRNVRIHDNILVGGAPHGFIVEQAEGVTIERNLAASSPNTNNNVAIRVLKSSGVTVRGNAAVALVIKDAPGSLIEANTLLPRRNVNFARQLEGRVLAGLRGEEVGQLVGRLLVLPEHRLAGARPR